MRKLRDIAGIFALFILTFTACTEKGIQGTWQCYDFVIADTTGIPSILVEESVKSAKTTLFTFNEDSTYQQDYVMEGAELFSERGHYSIKENHLVISPEKIGIKELSDQGEIQYKSIANNDFLTEISQAKDYQYELKGNRLSLIDYIYNAQSRNKTNKTTMKFKRNQ